MRRISGVHLTHERRLHFPHGRSLFSFNYDRGTPASIPPHIVISIKP